MLEFRKSLPSFKEKEGLLQAIARNQVCLPTVFHYRFSRVSYQCVFSSLDIENHTLYGVHFCLLLLNL